MHMSANLVNSWFSIFCDIWPFLDQRHSGSTGERPTTTTGGAAGDDMDQQASRDSSESPTPDCGQSNVSDSPVTGVTATTTTTATSGRFTPNCVEEGFRGKLHQQRNLQFQQPSTTTIMSVHHSDNLNRLPAMPQLQQSRHQPAISSSTSGRDTLPPSDIGSIENGKLDGGQKKSSCAGVGGDVRSNYDELDVDGSAQQARAFCPPLTSSKMASSSDDDIQRQYPHLQQQLQQQIQMQNAFYSGSSYGSGSNFYAQQQQQLQQHQQAQQQNAAVASWAENQLAAAAGNYFRSVPDCGYSALVGNATSSAVAGRATVEYRPNNTGGSRVGSAGYPPAAGSLGGFTSGPSLYSDGIDYSSFYGANYRSAAAAAAHSYKQEFWRVSPVLHRHRSKDLNTYLLEVPIYRYSAIAN